MNLRKMVLTSIFLAIGLILHQAMPPILFGMKPDLMLCMMFIVLYLNRKDYKMTILIGIVAGLFSAFSTTFPFGQIPNIVDKIITANIIFLLFKVMDSKVKDQIQIIIASIIGTFVSGIVFLSTALFLAGLPGPFSALVIGVVLPAVLLNTLMCVFLYNIVIASLKRSNKAY
ncbi:tryptophan transporter [Soehngenia saccharolytica]|nr:tryptophan transporter [Soehngenia saccharolytica]